jgi:hypothetical protein
MMLFNHLLIALLLLTAVLTPAATAADQLLVNTAVVARTRATPDEHLFPIIPFFELSSAPLGEALPSTSHHSFVCDVYLAASTLQGGGQGLFAGKDFAPRSKVLPSPSIPLTDTNGETLLDNYMWEASAAGFFTSHDEEQPLHAFMLGFGSLANHFDTSTIFPVQGAMRGYNVNDYRTSPAFGSFSQISDASFFTEKAIATGDEMFAYYGK